MDYRLKDVVRLVKKIDKLTDGQASVDLQSMDWDGAESFTSFKLMITPNGGHYKGGLFDFTVTLPFDYPSTSPPVVWCNTRVYHPNIDMDETSYFDETSTNVCLNLFEYGTWQTSYSLDLVVLGLVFLFHHPNLQDPLAEGFSGNETETEFAENVRKYMAGEEVNEMKYGTNFKVVNGVMVERGGTSLSNNASMQITNKNDSFSHNSMKSNESTTDVIETSVCSEWPDSDNRYESSRNASSAHDNNNNTCTKETEDSSKSADVLAFEYSSSEKHKKDVNELLNDTEFHSTQNTVTSDNYVAEGEVTLEYIEVDGEYILKPKSIDIQETGVIKCDKNLVFRECDLDEVFDVDLESSRDTVSLHKPRGFCSCLQSLRRVMSRIISSLRRPK